MENSKKMSIYDLNWIIALFGTAIGAGVLFLPIRVGLTGLYPIIILAILIVPMTFLSHRFLARFSIASNKKLGVTNVAVETFGKSGGLGVTVLYFFAIYPICLAYGVGITNTIKGFMEVQMGMGVDSVNRWVLAIVLITGMMGVMIKGKDFVIKATNLITFPLIAVIFGFSLYLIPHWRPLAEQIPPATGRDWFNAIYLCIPTLVFAFNHSPAISEFAISIKEKYQDEKVVEQKLSLILGGATTIITIFALFFVISFVMTLPPEAMADAKASNLSILSFFANQNPQLGFAAYVGPIIALTAILSSFFGHYLGAHEGLVSTLKQVKGETTPADDKKISTIAASFIYVSMIIVAGLNPSILGFIEDLGGPFIAMMLYVMPIVAVYKLPTLAKFKGKPIQIIYIAITGTIAISGIVLKLIPGLF